MTTNQPVHLASYVAAAATGPWYMGLSWLFWLGSSFCESNYKWLVPVLYPLIPFNPISWILFILIIIIIASVPINILNSVDSKTKNGWRVFFVSFFIYYVIAFIFWLIYLLIVCKIYAVGAEYVPTSSTLFSNLLKKSTYGL